MQRTFKSWEEKKAEIEGQGRNYIASVTSAFSFVDNPQIKVETPEYAAFQQQLRGERDELIETIEEFVHLHTNHESEEFDRGRVGAKLKDLHDSAKRQCLHLSNSHVGAFERDAKTIPYTIEYDNGQGPVGLTVQVNGGLGVIQSHVRELGDIVSRQLSDDLVRLKGAVSATVESPAPGVAS